MNNLIGTLVVTLAVQSFAFDSVASAACGLFEHPNGTGAGLRLENNTAHNDFRNIMISRRSWHGYLGGWRGSDRNFNDEVTSLAIGDNCTLEVYEHVGYQGAVKTFFNGAHNLKGVFDNIPSSAVCRCGGEVRNSAPIADAPGSGVVLQELWGR